MTETLAHPAPAEGGLALVSGPELPTPDATPVTLIDAIASRLRLWPDGELWTCDDAGRPLSGTYARLWARSLAIAAGLLAHEVRPGRVAVLVTGDALEFTTGFWACLRAGLIVLPMTRRPGPGGADEAVQVLGGLGDPLLVADAASEPLAQEIARRLGLTVLAIAGLELEGAALPAPDPVPRPPGLPACLLQTSGSTGRVKLAALTEAVLIRRRFVRFRLGPPRPFMTVFDLDTVTGMTTVLPHTPCYLHMPPAVAAGRPLAIVDSLARHGALGISLTCTMAGLLADALERSDGAWDLSQLELCGLGAERIDPFVAGRLAAAFVRHGAKALRCVAGYGSTETGNIAAGAPIPLASSAVEASGPLCLGGAPAGVSLRIVDDGGRTLSPGAVGQIEVLAPGLTFCGYWGDEAATRAAFTADGWWRSGDLGALVDGQVWLHGRAKDVIVVRGRKHGLAEIDARLQVVLAEFPAGASGGGRVLSCPVVRGGDATELLAVVVFGDPLPPAGERELLERAMRRTTAMEFGLTPAKVAYASMAELPLGASGKVIRRALADLVVLDAAEPSPTPPGERPGLAAGGLDRLAELWRQVLRLAGPLGPDSDFFELGGDSLASEQLFAGLEAWFGRRVPAEAFFAAPTLGALQTLLDQAGTIQSAPAKDEIPWPLPVQLHERLLTRMETWPGERPTADRLMAGLNLSGSRPPLFWIFQGGDEFEALAGALGPDQPLYGFRSGHLVFRYTEDQVQQVALRYLQDILQVCPEGPMLLGANCQGGMIALAMAQHLVRRRRTPRLLVLMEWGFELQPYPGEVLFLHGKDSLQGNPHLRHRRPELAWRRLLSSYEVEQIPGAHGGYFMAGNVAPLAGALARHAARVLSSPPPLAQIPAEAVELTLRGAPARMTAGQGLRLAVEVRNVGSTSWDGAEAWGLMAGDYWLGPGGQVERWLDARTPAPSLQPGEAATLWLDISAPPRPGEFTLVVDMVEEGNRWLDPPRSRAPQVQVTVEG